MGALAVTAAAAPPPAAALSAYTPVGTAPFWEGSGIVASRQYRGVFWALQDSGGPARTKLWAFKIEGGRLVELKPGVRFRSVDIEGTTNRDWEALSVDDRGNLWIGDIGNNGCQRNDLKVHRVSEPDPYQATDARIDATFPMVWPNPAGDCTGYDAESLVVVDNRPFVISKTNPAGVYRFATLQPGERNRLEKVGQLTPPYNRSGTVPTDASVSTDGNRLVVAAGNKLAWVYVASNPSLTGEAAIKDLVDQPPRWLQNYDDGGSRMAVEGVAFVVGSYDFVLLSESKEILYFPDGFYRS